MSNVEINIFPKPENVAYEAAHYINKKLEHLQGTPVLLLVSGGSGLTVLEYINLHLCEDVSVAQIDERITPHRKERNITALEKTEFVSMGNLHFLSIEQGKTPKESAAHYESTLRQWVHDNAGGFTIAILGMGPDGHTAGMMNGFDALFNQKHWVVGYKSTHTFPHRVTVTNTFLKEVVDESILYFIGDEKREAWNHVHTLPAGVIFNMKHVALFTDQAVSL